MEESTKTAVTMLVEAAHGNGSDDESSDDGGDGFENAVLVVDGDDLIGYSARNPNRVVLKNKDCECFREIVIEEILPGQARTRTLSLQYIASDIWFTSGVDKLYLISDQGKILWQLTHDGLKGRPTGFHSAVIFD